MSQHQLGTALGIAVVALSIFVGISLIFTAARSSQISEIEKTREGDENE